MTACGTDAMWVQAAPKELRIFLILFCYKQDAPKGLGYSIQYDP